MSEEEQNTAPKTKSRKVIKWLGIAIAGLIALLLIVIVSVYFILRSGTLTQTAVENINPVAKAFGVEIIKLQSANIDLLGEIDIQGLELKWQDEELGQAHLLAKQFQLNYLLADLLTPRLTVTNLLLHGVAIKAQVNSPTEPVVKEELTEPLDLSWLAELLKTPPLPLDLQRITLAEIDIDLNLKGDKQSQSLQGNLNQLTLAMGWSSEQLQVTTLLNLNNKPPKPWRVAFQAEDLNYQFNFIPEWQNEINLDLRNANNQWRLPLFNLSNNTRINKLSIIDLNHTESNTIVESETLEVNFQANKAQTDIKNLSKGLEGLFPLTLITEVETDLPQLNIDYISPLGNLQSLLGLSALINLNTEIANIEPFALSTEYEIKHTLNLQGSTYADSQQNLSLEQVNAVVGVAGEMRIQPDQTISSNGQVDFNLDSSPMTFSQKASAENPTAVNVEVAPEIALTGNYNITDVENILLSEVELQPKVVLQNLVADIKANGETQQYSIDSTTLDSTIHLVNKKLSTSTQVTTNKLAIPQLNKVISTETQLALESDLDLTELAVDLAVQLEKEALLEAKLKAQNNQNKLALHHNFYLNLPLKLTALHEAAEPLQLVGHTENRIQGDVELNHKAESILEADFDQILDWPVTTQGKVEVRQLTAPAVKEGVTLKDSLVVNYQVDKQANINTTLAVQSAGVQVEPLLRAMPLKFINQSEFTWPLSKTQTKGQLEIDGTKALDFNLLLIDSPQNVELDGELTLAETPDWKKYLAELQELEQVGAMSLKLKPKLILRHPATTLLEFDPEAYESIAVDLNYDAVVTQSKDQVGTQIILEQPLTLTQTLRWSREQLNSTIRFFIGSLEIPQQATIKNLPGKITVNASDGLQPKKAELFAKLESADISVLVPEENTAQVLQVGNLATPLALKADIEMQETQGILNELKLTLGDQVVNLTATGRGQLDGSSAQVAVDFKSTLNDSLLPGSGLQGSGSIAAPLELVFIGGEQLSMDGMVRFEEFSLRYDDLALEMIQGNIKLNEELLIRDDAVGFRYLLDANPFQRVDFSRIQPYLDIDNVLSFASIRSGDLQIGPGMATVAIDQNLINVKRWDLEAFNGSIMGQLFFDMTPDAQRLGVLSRLSQIDPRILLPDTSVQKQSEYSPLSARTAFTFDVTERLVEGEVDVTQITKTQLLQLLELVDPEHKDEQVATLRSALRLAFPKWVKVDMMSGLMNIEVAVSALPKPIQVRGLPLTPLIQQYAGELEELLVQLPLRKM